jgi:cbb3-type cytochrome oxidase subunit 1
VEIKVANAQASVYDDTVVRQSAIMTVVWGVVGMLVGVIIAAQLAWPELNFGIPWLSYGRLRPLHTNAVIFAFGGCGLVCHQSITWCSAPAKCACLRQAGRFHLLGLAAGDCGCSHYSCPWATPAAKNMLNWNGRLTS